MGADIEQCKDIEKLLLNYSLDTDDRFEDKNKMVSKWVMEIEITNEAELKIALDLLLNM